MTDKPFRELCSLIDQFWQTLPYVVKPGKNPDYQDDLYLKLYWFGLLTQCPSRERLLQRAWKQARWLFKKNRVTAPLCDDCHTLSPCFASFGVG